MPTAPRRLPGCAVMIAVLAVGCADDGAAPTVTEAEAEAEADTGSTTAAVGEVAEPAAAHTTTPSSSPTTAGRSADPVAPWWPADPRASDGVDRWTVDIIERIDHDPTAFTQGLEVADGVGYESTGRRGESTIRRFDPATGSVLDTVPLDDSHFGEGLTVVGDAVIQLTWRAGTALRWDRTTLAPLEASRYDGEGWGLCASRDGLVLSDGTPDVRIVDPETFEVERRIEVTLDGEPVPLLNELECIDGLAVANIWKASRLVVFDPGTGAVVAEIDATVLSDEVADSLPSGEQNVLNGVAALDDGTLLLSGKLWPTTFRVRLVQS